MLTQQSKHSLSYLAERFNLELIGQADHCIDGVGTLNSATASQISFLSNPAYRAELPGTRAGAVILKQEDAEACQTNCLVARDPYVSYARIASLYAPVTRQEPGVHPSAVVHPTAKLGSNVAIGPNAVVEADCDIGEACSIGPGVVIGRGCTLGAACLIYANATLYHGTQLGQRVIVHSAVVLGADGFGFAFAGDHWEKVPQLGRVIIGDDCEIGAGTTIDRGANGDTVLEEDIKMDNQCMIGHNVHVGAHTAMAAKAGIAGSARVGRYCLLGGGCGIQGHMEVADRVTIAARSILYYPVTEAGSTWSALIPSQPIAEWQRNLSRLRKLDQLARRVLKLEKKQNGQNNND